MNWQIPLIFLVALTGIGIGIILSYIAPEELRTGKKYFLLLKNVLWLIIFVILAYDLIQNSEWFLLILSFVAFAGALVFESKYQTNFAYFIDFAILGAVYFSSTNLQLTVAALTFLYGFPAGTLLGIKYKTR